MGRHERLEVSTGIFEEPPTLQAAAARAAASGAARFKEPFTDSPLFQVVIWEVWGYVHV
jgi:hypothetical protein